MMPRVALVGTGLALSACSSGVTPEQMAQIKPGMKAEQVQAILGQPATVEQSESADQAISGEVDHYPGAKGEGRVVIVNHAVFQAQFVPGAKS